MRDLMFYYPVIRALEDGAVIRKSLRIALQIIGILSIAGGLYLFVQLLKFSVRTDLAEATIGGLLLAVLLLAASVCVFQICFYRADSIAALPPSPFTVIPAFSILLRTVGEAWATFGALFAAGGCLFIWMTQMNPQSLLSSVPFGFPSAGGGGTFVSGLSFLAATAAFSFAVLVVFYFLAESVMVAVDIAMHVRRLAALPAPSAGPDKAAPHPAEQAPARRTVCPQCHEELEPGAQFCGMCGFRLG